MANRRLPAVAKCARVCHVAHVGASCQLSHTSARLRLPLSAPSAESCWRFKHWTPRRASRSGVVAPDAAMPWCVRVCQRAARPSPKHATPNRVFVIRADKGGSQRVLRLRMHHTSAHRKRYSTLFTRLPCTPSATVASAELFEFWIGANSSSYYSTQFR